MRLYPNDSTDCTPGDATRPETVGDDATGGSLVINQVPPVASDDESISDLVAALTSNEPLEVPDPAPRPYPTEPSLGEAALWYFDVGYRVGEDKPRSKHAAKHHDDDTGARRTRLAVKVAWNETPHANIALRLGPQRDPETCVIVLDADGAAARKFVEAELTKAGCLDTTPTCVRDGGDGAKFVLQAPAAAAMRSARLMVPGSTNEGHDGLEWLAFGKKATVPPSVHPSGAKYTWTVPLPPDPSSIPMCPESILGLPRKETVVVAAPLAEDLRLRTSHGVEKTVAEWRVWMTEQGITKVGNVIVPAELRMRRDSKPSGYLLRRGERLTLIDDADGLKYRDGLRETTTGPKTRGPATDTLTEPFGHVFDDKVTHDPARPRFGPPDFDYKDGVHRLSPVPLLACIGLARAVFIKAPIGAGKTTAIRTFLRVRAKELGRPVKVLVVAHRKSLVNHAVRVYELATDYRKVSWREVPPSELESLGLCIDSLDRGPSRKLAGRLTYAEDFEIKSLRWDAVILDEAESLFRHIHGGTLGDDSHRAYRTLRGILRLHTDLAVLADAHLSDYAVREYRAMVGGDHKRDILIHDRRKRSHLDNPRLARLARPEDAEKAALDLADAGKPFYLAVTRERVARRLHRKLKAKHPERLWPLVTGRHDDPDGEAFLKEPNEWIKANRPNIGGVIYTSAIESGVSIDEPLVAFDKDTVLLMGWGDHATWQDLVQMVGRPRKTRVIGAWVEPHGRAPWLDEDTYALALREARAKEHALLMESGLVNGRIERVPLDAEHFGSHVRTVVHEGRSRRSLGEDWWAYWQSNGCSVSDITALDPDAVKAHRDQAAVERDALDREDALVLVQADNDKMTVKEAEAIIERDAAPAKRLAAEKTLVEDFYGKDATVELALWDERGKGRSRVRAFNAVRLAADDNLAAVLKPEAKQAGLTAKVRHAAIAAIITWDAFRAAGVKREHLNGTATEDTLTPLDLDGLADYLARPSTRRAYKVALGLDPWAYLGLTGGRRSRKQGAGDATGGSLAQNNVPPVAPDPLTQDELDALVGDAGPEVAVRLAERAEAKTAQRASQVMRLLREMARRCGVRFISEQAWSGPNRGKRTYRIDPASVNEMLDHGAEQWQRLGGAPRPSELMVLLGMAA